MRATPTPILLLTMLLLVACQPAPHEAADAAHGPAAVVEADPPATPAADADGHDHAMHAEAQAEPPLPPDGERWQADAALTRGMQALRAVALSLQELPQEADPAAVAALGERVEHAVHRMFAECRLAPEPDAALHALLAEVIGARQQLGVVESEPGAAQATLARVLEQYDQRFVEQP